ncbi:MAG: cation-transporting P-type ATPase [Methanobacteriota archaeon]|nr:MAG: cation-transporting P-type ATPase [Euryarchaeota archaeon]
MLKNIKALFGFENMSISLPHAIPLDELLSQLHTDRRSGLNLQKVREHYRKYGENEIITKSPSIWKIYLAPLFDVLITIYLIMTGFLVILAIWYPPILGQVLFWLSIIAFNMAIAIFQQFRAQKKLDALRNLSPPKAKVIREGVVSEIDAKFLVPGDLVILELGDRVSADMRILSSVNLTVNEASLTGESKAVNKVEDGSIRLPEDTPIAERKNMLYMGTFIQTGNARAIVCNTGNDTELGSIAQEISEMQSLEIPLRSRVNAIAKKLVAVMLVLFVASVIFKFYIRITHHLPMTPEAISQDLVQSIITAMSVMPINIPLLTTIILITGVVRMAQENVIVKELSVIETLGRTSVLCSDKTGTMTTSKMAVSRIWDTENYYAVKFDEIGTVSIYQIDETMKRDATELEQFLFTQMNQVPRDSALELLLTATTLNNDANLIIEDVYGEKGLNLWEAVGNATDAAFLILSYRSALDQDYIRKRYVKLRDYPFNSTVKRMTKLFHDTLENDYMVFSKGAAEVLLPRCSQIGNEGRRKVRELGNEEKEAIQKDIDSFANLGYRVVVVAYKAIDSIPEFANPDEERNWMESDLTFIGFACLLDPPRPGVKEAVRKLDEAGIFPIMITGDSPKTASTIAAQVGILDPDEIVIEGKQIPKLSEEDFFKVSVFARVSPQDKKIIVDKYQRRGDVVTMTGDGVNDSLAITRADAGVAMGITGTEVTKESADIILADDSYVSLVKGVEQGRSLFEKIRMVIFFFIAVNIAEGIVYFSTSFLPGFVLLNNAQRAFIFSIMHGIPPAVLIFDSMDKDIMKLKPRQHDAVINKRLFMAMLSFILPFSAILIGIYFFSYNEYIPLTQVNLQGITPILQTDGSSLHPTSYSQAKARTMLIASIYLTESLFIFSIRRINQSFLQSVKDASIFVWFMVVFGPLILLITMYFTPIQIIAAEHGFRVDLLWLGPMDWLICLSLAVIPIIVLESFKSLMRKQEVQF